MLRQSIAILAFTATIALPTTIAAVTAMTPTPQSAKVIKSRGTQKIQVRLYDRSIEGFSRLIGYRVNALAIESNPIPALFGW